jgi:hypothetical protein
MTIWHTLGRPCGAEANEAEGITEYPSHVTCKVCLEITYLRWIVSTMDFGPAHGDVVDLMNQEYEEATGFKVPEGWRDEA